MPVDIVPPLLDWVPPLFDWVGDVFGGTPPDPCREQRKVLIDRLMAEREKFRKQAEEIAREPDAKILQLASAGTPDEVLGPQVSARNDLYRRLIFPLYRQAKAIDAKMVTIWNMKCEQVNELARDPEAVVRDALRRSGEEAKTPAAKHEPPQQKHRPDSAQVAGPALGQEARTQWQSGRLQEARQTYRRAIARDPSNPDLYFELARLLEQLNEDLSEIIEYYETFLDLAEQLSDHIAQVEIARQRVNELRGGQGARAAAQARPVQQLPRQQPAYQAPVQQPVYTPVQQAVPQQRVRQRRGGCARLLLWMLVLVALAAGAVYAWMVGMIMIPGESPSRHEMGAGSFHLTSGEVIALNNSQEVYVFYAYPGQTLILNATARSGSLQPSAYLLDPNYDEVAYTLPSGRSTSLYWEIRQEGTYQLAIGGRGFGRFTLDLALEPAGAVPTMVPATTPESVPGAQPTVEGPMPTALYGEGTPSP